MQGEGLKGQTSDLGTAKAGGGSDLQGLHSWKRSNKGTYFKPEKQIITPASAPFQPFLSPAQLEGGFIGTSPPRILFWEGKFPLPASFPWGIDSLASQPVPAQSTA